MKLYETRLKMYSNCKDISSLSLQEAKYIRDAFSFLLPKFADGLKPEKLLQYDDELRAWGKITEEKETSKEFLKDFFGKWQKKENEGLENLLEKATQAYSKESLEGKKVLNEEKIGLALARAFIAFNSQRYDESLRLFEEISPDIANIKECCFEEQFSKAYYFMAKIYFTKGSVQQGIESCKKSIESGESYFKDRHTKAQNFIDNSKLLFEDNENRVALNSETKAHEPFLKLLKVDHPLQRSPFFTGNLHYFLGRDERSLKTYEALLNFVQKYSPENKEDVAASYLSMSKDYLTLNQSTKASEFFEKYKGLLVELHGAQSPEIVTTLHDWAKKLKGKGVDREIVLGYLQEAIEIHKKLPQDFTMESRLLYLLSEIQVSKSMYPEAKQTLEACEKIMNKTTEFKEKDWIYYYQGFVATMQNELEKGIEIYNKVLQTPGLDFQLASHCYNNIAVSYQNMGDKDKAEEAYLKALKAKKDYFGLYNPNFRNYLSGVLKFLKDNQSLDKVKEVEEQYKQDPEFASHLFFF